MNNEPLTPNPAPTSPPTQIAPTETQQNPAIYSHPQVSTRKPFNKKMIVFGLFLSVILVGGVFGGYQLIDQRNTQSGGTNNEATEGGGSFSPSFGEDKAKIAASDSKEMLNKRLSALEAQVNNTTNSSAWVNGDSNGSMNSTNIMYIARCKIGSAGSSQAPIRCSTGTGVSKASGYDQAITLEINTSTPQINFKNNFGNYSFDYVENAQREDNRFALFFQDKSIPFTVTSRLSVGAYLTGLQLDQGNIVQGATQPTIKAELAKYTLSASSLRSYSLEQLDRLRTRAKKQIEGDEFKKYVDCKTDDRPPSEGGIMLDVEPGQICSKANLTTEEKAALLSNIYLDIEKKESGVNKHYQTLYDALIKALFAKECPVCWQ